MRKLFYFVLVLSLVSCGKKEWSREYLAEKCKKNMAKDTRLTNTLTAEQQAKVCDCSAEKVMAKYKTKAEADKDETGIEAIGSECVTAVLMPSEPSTDTTGMNMPVDTTQHPDTSNQ